MNDEGTVPGRPVPAEELDQLASTEELVATEGLASAELGAAEELRAAVGAFVRQVRAHDTMPGGQSAVLGQLARDGELSITELAERERVRHQSMARTVKLLAGQGLAGLIVDDADRRRVLVRITPAGTRQLDQERRQRAGWIERAIRTRLDPAEQALIGRIPGVLKKLIG